MLRLLTVALCLVANFGLAQDISSETELRNAVGRLDIGETAFCTGALVSGDIVLTAAHCLFDKETGDRFDLADMAFRPGLTNGESAATRGVQAVFIHPNYQADKKGDLRNLPFDLALLKLNRPLQHGASLAIDVSYPNLGGAPASVLSYGKGRSDTAMMQRDCLLSPHSKGIILTTCQANSGTSGAPVFQMRNGQPSIVSIVSAMARADGTPVSLVVPIAEALDALHQGLANSATPARFQAN